MSDARSRARALAREALAAGAPTGWFETLYREADAGRTRVPWDDRVPNPELVRWLDAQDLGSGDAALDVGCGTGDNAAELARRGLAVTAFDVSPTAIASARARYGAIADWQVADVLALPEAWTGRFRWVCEAYTLQVLPPELRGPAARAIAATVAPGGSLLVVARARDDDEPTGELPWPLTRAEISAAAVGDLRLASLEDRYDAEDPPVRRWIATLRR